MMILNQDTINQYSDGRDLLSAPLIERTQLLWELEKLAKVPQVTGTTESIVGFDLVKAQDLLFELSIISEKMDALILQINGYADQCGKPRVEIVQR